jgi:allantoicase
VRRAEVDTTHYKGNAPGSCSLDACAATAGTDEGPPDPLQEWHVLMPEAPLLPHTRHVFDRELVAIGRVTHVRFNIFPDGGVGRLRLFGMREG